MLRFVPINQPMVGQERIRAALSYARRRVAEALGPGAEVGEISAGGFEVVVPSDEQDVEEKVQGAMQEAAMKEEDSPGLRFTSSGSIVTDRDSMDGSMIGL